MKFGKKIKIGTLILNARLSGKKRPVAVGWSLTKQCNFNCRYCGSAHRVGQELSDEQLMILAQQIVDAGVLKVAFTGGEPLLRRAVIDLVPFLAKRGVSVTIDTNGTLLPGVIDRLYGLDGVLLSLDGAEPVNDLVRGKGAYKATMEALKAAKVRNIRAVLTCVLSRWNVDDFEPVLETAEQFNTVVQFQPAIGTLLGVDKDNPGSPEPGAYKRTLDKLLAMKKGRYGKRIGNSISGLEHLRKWPEPNPMKCLTALVAGRIEPDGAMYHCGRVIAQTKRAPNVLDQGFRAAFEQLKTFQCANCWCAQRLELILASEMTWNVLKNMVSIY